MESYKPVYKERVFFYNKYYETGFTDEGDMQYIKEPRRLTYSIPYCGNCGKRLCSRFMNFCPNCGGKVDE